jgi:hypothetical protein
MRSIIIISLAICCLGLSSCAWQPRVAQAEAVVSMVREQRELAIAAGVSQETVDKYDALLADAEAALAAAKDAPSWYVAVIAAAAAIASGGAGAAIFGAKAAMAAKVLHTLRAVVSGIDTFRDITGKAGEDALLASLRDTMTQKDKDLIKEVRAAKS